MNIKEVLTRPEYSFITSGENKYLDDMLFITFGGSISYGLDTPQSDIDIRGVCNRTRFGEAGIGYLETKTSDSEVFGQNGFEQYNDIETDTVIYGIDKFVKLLYKCNPNVIEMLGCRKQDYVFFTEGAKNIPDMQWVFLSKLAYESFVGYARGQFQRLKNALGKDSCGNFSRTVSLADAIQRMQHHFEMCYPDYKQNMITVNICDKSGSPVYVNGVKVVAGDTSLLFNSNNEKVLTVLGKPIDPENVELRFDLNFDNISASQFSSITNEINTQLKEFTKVIGHRNNKKDDYHLCKHAMHLLRLYMMCYDILTKHEIITYREDDHDLLMSVKNGLYFTGKTFTTEFFDMIQKYEDRLAVAYRQTTLPDAPNPIDIEHFVSVVTER